MTSDEALKVLKIGSQVDAGCPPCVGEFMEEMATEFPEWSRMFEAASEMSTDFPDSDEWDEWIEAQKSAWANR